MKKLLLISSFTISIMSLGQTVQDSLLQLSKKESLSERERVDIFNELANQTKSYDPPIAFSYAKEAFSLARKNDYQEGMGKASISIGEYHWLRSEYEKSLEWGLSALRTLKPTTDTDALMKCYYLLGLTYNHLKDTLKGDYYINNSLTLALKLNDNEMEAKVYNSQGLSASIRRRDYKLGLPLYLKALTFVQKNDKSAIKINILGNIGSVYDFIGEPKKSLEFLSQALELALTQKNRVGEAHIHLLLGDFYRLNDNYSLSEEHYLTCERLAKQVGARGTLQNCYLYLGALKAEMGLNTEAHEYQKKYAMARDSIFNAERAQKIAELEERFELTKKEQDIELLKSESQIQEIWRNVLIVGLLGGILASYLIYRLQRSRNQKTKQLLNIQEILNGKLKEIDKLKTGFFANISHEFRTPLTLILAPLENELKKKSAPEAKESLLLIKRSANRLLELVNQLLDLSKLESGKLDLHVKQGDLSRLLSMIHASFDSLAEHKRIEFVKNVDLDEQLYWYDQDKVEKIVTNLLSNAIKYTPLGGQVTFDCSCDNHSLTIIVADTGPGIPESEQPHVFTAFYQGKSVASNLKQGSGLGLSLVKELIRLYNGTISLKSAPETGSTFTIKIPIEKTAFNPDQIVEESPEVYLLNSLLPQPTPENSFNKNSEPIPNGRDAILVVEDNADMREFISTTLQNKDFAVFTAQDGKEGLQIALKYVPSLVLSDLMMPSLNGIELTEKIKNDERTSHIPVILLTAKNESQSRIEGLTVGADDYLTKPFSPDELLVRINNLIKQRKKLAEKFRERIIVPATQSNQMSLDDKFLYRTRNVVESNLGDYTFTVEKLAEEMNLSRTQLLRKLKALTGISPNDFIKDIRLKRAADMIQQRVDTITQIGYAVGFNDQSYFTKCFKKKFNYTPTEYSVQFTEKRELHVKPESQIS